MATLPDRPSTAVVVIDVQTGVVANAHARAEVLGNIRAVVDRARAAAVPVVWVRHSDENLVHGSDWWEFVPELEPGADESIVEKHWGDAFEHTELEQVLAASGIGRLVVAGAQTDACIRATLHGALVRGYDALLVSDAHTTEDNTAYGSPQPELVIKRVNFYWSYERLPGRTGGTVATTELDFAALP